MNERQYDELEADMATLKWECHTLEKENVELRGLLRTFIDLWDSNDLARLEEELTAAEEWFS